MVIEHNRYSFVKKREDEEVNEEVMYWRHERQWRRGEDHPLADSEGDHDYFAD